MTLEDFIFLTMLDFNSYVMRKNPVGAIEAFKRAFPDTSSKERLIIKTINGHVHPKKLNELLHFVNNDFRIILMDGPLSRARICGLIREADCFVSLHRAEGFGRVLAESMFLETPVIATDYSGSATFLNKSNGFPIPFKLRDVQPGEYIFEEGSKWAEPDLDAAVEAFRLVRHRLSLVARKIDNAKTTIIKNHGRNAVIGKIVERLTVINKQIEARTGIGPSLLTLAIRIWNHETPADLAGLRARHWAEEIIIAPRSRAMYKLAGRLDGEEHLQHGTA